MNATKSNPGTAFEEMYTEMIHENLEIVSRFPSTLVSALALTETMSPSDDGTTSIKVKTAVSECLNSLKHLSKAAADLELLAES